MLLFRPTLTKLSTTEETQWRKNREINHSITQPVTQSHVNQCGLRTSVTKVSRGPTKSIIIIMFDFGIDKYWNLATPHVL